MGTLEPFVTPDFTVLGRGYDPAAVAAYVDGVLDGLVLAESRAELWVAYSDAADILAAAADEAARIRLEAYAAVVAVHDHAAAELAQLESGCRLMSTLVVGVASAVDLAVTDDLHIVVEPDSDRAGRMG